MRCTTSLGSSGFLGIALQSLSSLGLLSMALLAACSSSSVPAASDPSSEPQPAPEVHSGPTSAPLARSALTKRSAITKRSVIPKKCAKGASSSECLPPKHWVSKLCSGVYPEVALYMFRKGTPWTRVFSKARAPALNAASGGSSLSDEKVDMHEELIALRRNDDGRDMRAGEMQMGDIAGYDFLRWNGSCVTLHDGEFSVKPPRRVSHSRVEWRWLGEGMQEALRSDGDVREAFVERRKECRGATTGRVTKECIKRDKYLMDAIVEYVRSGGDLPEPSEHP